MSDGLKKKIAVGGIEHETAGFLPGETSLEDFLKSKISAHELKTISGESNTVIDGYLSGINIEVGISLLLFGLKLNLVPQHQR